MKKSIVVGNKECATVELSKDEILHKEDFEARLTLFSVLGFIAWLLFVIIWSGHDAYCVTVIKVGLAIAISVIVVSYVAHILYCNNEYEYLEKYFMNNEEFRNFLSKNKRWLTPDSLNYRKGVQLTRHLAAWDMSVMLQGDPEKIRQDIFTRAILKDGYGNYGKVVVENKPRLFNELGGKLMDAGIPVLRISMKNVRKPYMEYVEDKAKRLFRKNTGVLFVALDGSDVENARGLIRKLGQASASGKDGFEFLTIFDDLPWGSSESCPEKEEIFGGTQRGMQIISTGMRKVFDCKLDTCIRFKSFASKWHADHYYYSDWHVNVIKEGMCEVRLDDSPKHILDYSCNVSEKETTCISEEDSSRKQSKVRLDATPQTEKGFSQNALNALSTCWEKWLDATGKNTKHLDLLKKLHGMEKTLENIQKESGSNVGVQEKLDKLNVKYMTEFRKLLERYEKIYRMCPDSENTEQARRALEDAADALALAIKKIWQSVFENEVSMFEVDAKTFKSMIEYGGYGKTIEETVSGKVEAGIS